MAVIGNSPTQQAFTAIVDYFNGNGSTTAFTLSRSVNNVQEVVVVIENVPQNPSTAYTISGNVITFTSAPPSGTNNIYVRYVSPIIQTIQPGQQTVGNAQMTAGAPYWDVNGNVGIGTSSPNAALGLARGIAASAMIEIAGNGNTTGTSSMAVGQDGGSSGYCWNRASGAALLFGTNNTERMRIDANGRITTPYQPACYLEKYNVSVGAGGTGNLSSTSATINRGGYYNSSTGLFTAPITGLYLISFGGQMSAYFQPHWDSYYFVSINGTQPLVVNNGLPAAQWYYAKHRTQLVSLAAGDSVGAGWFNNPNSGQTQNTSIYFAIQLVG
jgi:hypothetical protein